MLALRRQPPGTDPPKRSRLMASRAKAAVHQPAANPFPSSPRSLVVIPTYNEHECIGTLLPAVRCVVDVHILVVDDSSPDGTADVVAAVQAEDPAIHLLVRPRRLGLASA